MANITSVTVHNHNDGTMSVFVYYRNRNKYRNDRVRMFPYIPKSTYKFIETATYKETTVYSDLIATEYSN